MDLGIKALKKYSLSLEERFKFDEVKRLTDESKRYALMNVYYTKYMEYEKKRIEANLAKVFVDLVVYDESEYFRQYNDPQFNYPYAPRKTRLSNFRFQVNDHMGDYQFTSTRVTFGRSSACLEGSYMDQANIFQPLFDAVVDIVKTSIL